VLADTIARATEDFDGVIAGIAEADLSA